MIQTGTRSFVKQHSYFLFLLFTFFIAELIIQPLGNFPLNDDWSYAKAVIVFNEKAEFNFGVWPAMTLASHILWGSLFTKLLGFSHFVLRFSTLISALIALTFLYKQVLKVSSNAFLATFAAAFLLFNPIFFSLANTYMTDVNFCTLSILCFYFIYQFHITGNAWYAIPVFLFSGLLVLLRQFGIIVPLCFIVSCIFSIDKKWRNVFIALLVTGLVIVLLKLYEDYLLRILPKNPTYKFSGNIDILSRVFWDTAFQGFKDKFCSILLQVLIYIFPLALLPLKNLIKQAGPARSVITILISLAFSYLLFWKEAFPFHNIFTNMKLGPEIFYQSLHGLHHNVSNIFGYIMNAIKITGPTVSLSSIILLFISRSAKPAFNKIDPVVVFLMLYTLAYMFMLFITESYFDRYILPLVVAGLLLLSYLMRGMSLSYTLAFTTLLLMIYIGVAGTKDYFEWNEKRWEAYRFLNERCKVPHLLINAGFETSCWTDEGFIISYSYLHIENVDFVVQFDKPGKNFRLMAEYPFQRYFPYKKDKINIFVREGIKIK